MLVEIKTIMDQVYNLLKDYPHLRDCDNKLVANIWNKEMKNFNVTDAFDFLQLYADKKITTADSITRARRKIQELHPELRGKNYNKRHNEEKKVRKNIVNLK